MINAHSKLNISLTSLSFVSGPSVQHRPEEALGAPEVSDQAPEGLPILNAEDVEPQADYGTVIGIGESSMPIPIDAY